MTTIDSGHSDLPDIRDNATAHAKLQTIAGKSQPLNATAKGAPEIIDLRTWHSNVKDRCLLGVIGVGLIEYFERRAFDKHRDASRLFLCEANLTLAGDDNDAEAQLRDPLKNLILLVYHPNNTISSTPTLRTRDL